MTGYTNFIKLGLTLGVFVLLSASVLAQENITEETVFFEPGHVDISETADIPETSDSGNVAADDSFAMQPYVRTNSLDSPEQGFDVNTIPSTMFTYWEQAAIIEAMLSEGFARPTTYGEMFDGDQVFEELPPPPPESRYLSLGGIVYRSPEKWTVWLNGKRVTPEALPPEAIDFKVKKNYIEIKWHDEYTNQIFPVRLRPHERFNIDTRIFLPGQS